MSRRTGSGSVSPENCIRTSRPTQGSEAQAHLDLEKVVLEHGLLLLVPVVLDLDEERGAQDVAQAERPTALVAEDAALVVRVLVLDFLEAADRLEALESHDRPDGVALGLALLERLGVLDDGLGVFAVDLPLARQPGAGRALPGEGAHVRVV